ncbi:MAG: patatin family protein [Campylobacteraceae bacterium]|nr:patatin family protein [Campylobacteraceae bacterium]
MNSALIVEGGGLRGLYGAGVIDFLAEKSISFQTLVGVSMGACNLANFASNQPKRNLSLPSHFIDDSRYLSYKRWLMGGDLFGMDFIFETIPTELDIFDYDAFCARKSRFFIVATDCESGEAVYFDKFDSREDFTQILKASCSLPFAAKSVKYGGKTLLDGGISDPIPLHFAQKQGAEKMVFILTQPKEYKKSAMKFAFLSKFFYEDALVKTLKSRHERYNETVLEINALEEKGEIFIIRPSSPLKAKRVERDREKLKAAYKQGYSDIQDRFEELTRYLEGVNR